MDIAQIRVRLHGQQTLRGDMQLLLNLGNEEIQGGRGGLPGRRNGGTNVFVFGRRRGDRGLGNGRDGSFIFASRDCRRIGRSGCVLEGEGIFPPESSDFLKIFGAVLAYRQQTGFQHAYRCQEELQQRPGGFLANAEVHGVLKRMRQLPGDLGKLWKSLLGRRTLQRTSGRIQPFYVFRPGGRRQKKAGVLPQNLQVFASFLQIKLNGFGSRRTHS